MMETPLASLFPALLKREAFSDVKLEGTDGIQVGANRHVLAVRSTVFDKLLCGQFQEADSPIIKFDFSSDVLKAVIDYCYTDKAELLENASSSASIVSLLLAADYFGLDGLVKKTRVHVSASASLALYFFQTCKTVGFVSTELTTEIETLALDTIRKKLVPIKNLDKDMLASIDPSVMKILLKDTKMRATEYSMFLLLKAWADASHRRQEARQLVQHIRLVNIAPNHLASVVEQSKLISSEQLEDTYKAQALLDRPGFKKERYTVRTATVWQRSTAPLVLQKGSDTLVCPPMKSEIHTWKLKVEKLDRSSSVEFGVMLASWKFNRATPIGFHRHGWAYRSDGTRWHNRLETLPDVDTFSEGSTVTLTLDLRPENGGTLSASINDGNSFEICNNLLQLEEVRSIGLVPAASVSDGATIRLVRSIRTYR